MSFVFNIKIMKIMQNWFILALISMFFAGLTILKEPVTAKILVGAGFILVGLLILAWK